MSDFPSAIDAEVIRHARVVPLDVVQAKGTGHAGTAVSLTPALYTLFQDSMRHAPNHPDWRGRDRFVLSAGHASLGLYLQLFLAGYGLEMDDLRAARTRGSRTPGHPEFGHTPGVETTTGPLGQGVGNAVGMAMEAVRLRRLLGTDLFSGHVWCVAGDGDLEEGVSGEASSLAGTLALGGLTVIWDDNRISIEGDTAITFGEDVVARYRAYGWEVLEVSDAEDLVELRETFQRARAVTDRPVFVRLPTRIGYPMPTVGGTAGAHSGAPGSEEIDATKRLLNLDPESVFDLPEHFLSHARRAAARGDALIAAWDGAVADWRTESPASAALFDRMVARDISPARRALDECRSKATAVATRVSSNQVLQAVMPLLPELWGGSADLAESNGVAVTDVASYIPDGVGSDLWPGLPGGQLVHFGIREHAMGAIVNGMALSGVTRPFGATFFVFSDYMRPAVRLAALMRIPSVFVWSHDSIAVGEDGPTHQPLEHLWSYRAIPGLAVARPADGIETNDIWRRVLGNTSDGPTAIVLSRQALPVVSDEVSVDAGAVRGAYVLREAVGGDPEAIIIATGSEVALAVAAYDELTGDGVRVRVVSAPCLEWFDAEDAAYRESVLPAAVTRRVSVEAGIGLGWHRYVGPSGRVLSVEEFGESGSGAELLALRGMTAAAVASAVRDVLAAG